MKRILLICLSMFLLFPAMSAMAQMVEKPAECDLCGMDRNVFNKSRTLLTFKDKSRSGTCSFNCAVQVMQNKRGKSVKLFQVADYETTKLIDGRKAFWVMGGSKRGVMSLVAKWAFSEKSGAEAFISQYGGSAATFDEVMKATEKELADEKEQSSHGKPHKH